LGKGAVMIVSPEGNRRTQFPLEVVPTNLAYSDPTRSGGSGPRAEDFATRCRRVLVLDAFESLRFLAVTTCPEEFGGSPAEVVVAKESFAANSVRLGRSGGAGSFFSAGGDSELTGA
jgi:hypothetical protein